MRISLSTLECLRCGHKWVPRSKDVYQCPKCKSPKWDLPKEQKAGEEK